MKSLKLKEISYPASFCLPNVSKCVNDLSMIGTFTFSEGGTRIQSLQSTRANGWALQTRLDQACLFKLSHTAGVESAILKIIK